jgi:hypothetical protein
MLLTAIGPDFDNGLSLSGAGSCLSGGGNNATNTPQATNIHSATNLPDESLMEFVQF